MGVFSAIAAHKQNKKAEDIADDREVQITQAMRMQIDQVGRQVEVEKLRYSQEAAQIRGRMRVAAADAGTGSGGSFAALTQQASVDEAMNTAIAEQNYRDAVARVRSDAQAAMLNVEQNLAATHVNPLLAGFSATLGGISTGLSIMTSLSAIKGASQPSAFGSYATPMTNFGGLPGTMMTTVSGAVASTDGSPL